MLDLNKSFDPKSIDINELLSKILSQKVVAVNIVIVISALAGAYFIYNNFLQQKRIADQNIANLQEKISTITTYQTTKQKFDDFHKALPKPVAEESLVNVLSDYAVQNSVEVISFSPVSTKEYDYYDLISVEMNVRSKEFKNLVLFIKAIESENQVIRIENYRFGILNELGQNLILRISTVRVKTK